MNKLISLTRCTSVASFAWPLSVEGLVPLLGHRRGKWWTRLVHNVDLDGNVPMQYVAGCHNVCNDAVFLFEAYQLS